MALGSDIHFKDKLLLEQNLNVGVFLITKNHLLKCSLWKYSMEPFWYLCF